MTEHLKVKAQQARDEYQRHAAEARASADPAIANTHRRAGDCYWSAANAYTRGDEIGAQWWLNAAVEALHAIPVGAA